MGRWGRVCAIAYWSRSAGAKTFLQQRCRNRMRSLCVPLPVEFSPVVGRGCCRHGCHHGGAWCSLPNDLGGRLGTQDRPGEPGPETARLHRRGCLQQRPFRVSVPAGAQCVRQPQHDHRSKQNHCTGGTRHMADTQFPFMGCRSSFVGPASTTC